MIEVISINGELITKGYKGYCSDKCYYYEKCGVDYYSKYPPCVALGNTVHNSYVNYNLKLFTLYYLIKYRL